MFNNEKKSKKKKSWVSKSSNCFPTLDSEVSIRVWGFPIAMLLVRAKPIALASSLQAAQGHRRRALPQSWSRMVTGGDLGVNSHMISEPQPRFLTLAFREIEWTVVAFLAPTTAQYI